MRAFASLLLLMSAPAAACAFHGPGFGFMGFGMGHPVIPSYPEEPSAVPEPVTPMSAAAQLSAEARMARLKADLLARTPGLAALSAESTSTDQLPAPPAD
jgi:hypothetical protein